MRRVEIYVHLSRFLLIISIALCFFYHFLPIGPFSNSVFDIGMLFILVCVWVFIRFSQQSSLEGNWLKPSNLFLLAYLAVNFQYLLDYRLGLKNNTSASIYHPEVLTHCFLLGLVGLLAFTAGYIRSVSKGKDKTNMPRGIHQSLHLSDSIRVPMVAMHALTFAVFLYVIDFSSFLSGESYGESMATYAHVEKLLGALNVVIVYFAATRSKAEGSFKAYLSAFPWLSLAIITVYMLLRLVSGDRGPFVYTALLLFYGYAYVSKKKWKLIPTVIVLSIAAACMSVIGIARHLDFSQSFLSRMDAASEVFASSGRFSNDRSISPLTEELGFSFVVNQTDVHAIEIEKESLHPGSYLLISILNGIPFAPGLITRLFHLSYEDFSSTGFANVHFFNSPERTWSIGTTIVGDFYLQLSVWGVLIGLFIAGLLMKEIDLVLYSKRKEEISMPMLVFALVFSSKCLYIPRSLLFGEMATFIMAFLVLYVLRFIFR